MGGVSGGRGGSATLLPPQIMCSEAITGLGWPLDPPLQNLPPPSPTWCFQINGLSTPWVSAPRLIIPNPVYRANNCRISHKKNILGASRRISRPTWEEWASELLYLVSTQRCFLLPPATSCDRPLVRFSNLIIFVFVNILVVINDNLGTSPAW